MATSLTTFGKQVANGEGPWEMQDSRGGGVHSVGLFDGIGCLRTALDLLGCEVSGHISIEKDPAARRVVEHHFPGTLHYPDIVDVNEKDVIHWSLTYGQVELVLIGAGPPCQGGFRFEQSEERSVRDERSSLFIHVQRIANLIRSHFPWAQTHTLMESVASMGEKDKDIMSDSFGDRPWQCDAGAMTWCNRPRLYWLTWNIDGSGPDVDIHGRRLTLSNDRGWERSVEAGWTKVDATQSFPTFTTSRPRTSRGHRPAGLSACDDDTVSRWEQDKHRFPPYQYLPRHCLQNRKGEYRLPSIHERE